LHYLLWFNKICCIALWISASSPAPCTFSNQQSRKYLMVHPLLKFLRKYGREWVQIMEGNLWSNLFWCFRTLTYPSCAPACNHGYIYLFWPNFCMYVLKIWYVVKLQQLKLIYLNTWSFPMFQNRWRPRESAVKLLYLKTQIIENWEIYTNWTILKPSSASAIVFQRITRMPKVYF
jgi:hypothetical protein